MPLAPVLSDVHLLRLQLCLLGVLAVLSTTPSVAAMAELRIGYQKASVNLLVARRLSLVEKRLPGMHCSSRGLTLLMQTSSPPGRIM